MSLSERQATRRKFNNRYFILDRKSRELLHECDTLAEARGFCLGTEEPTIVCAGIQSIDAVHGYYRVCIADHGSGQIVARGPVLDVVDALDSLIDLKIILVPYDENEPDRDEIVPYNPNIPGRHYDPS